MGAFGISAENIWGSNSSGRVSVPSSRIGRNKYEAESRMYFSQRIPRPTSYKLPNQIIHFYPPHQKNVETSKTFKCFSFGNKFSTKTLVPCFQLAPSPKTPPRGTTASWPEGPESLDIMRKSKAKPIIPPAAHQ